MDHKSGHNTVNAKYNQVKKLLTRLQAYYVSMLIYILYLLTFTESSTSLQKMDMAVPSLSFRLPFFFNLGSWVWQCPL